MKFRVLIPLIFTFLALPLALVADDDHHHFDPNEKLGTVSFPTSCTPGVQKAFERGVALLHSFGYDEASEQFQEIEQQDTQCAMAYWGEAMSLYHLLWTRTSDADIKRGQGLLNKAQTLKAKRNGKGITLRHWRFSIATLSKRIMSSAQWRTPPL